ncbi:mCG1036130 [Mus musculus]|nr:mCG1036130 [Mus musculus]
MKLGCGSPSRQKLHCGSSENKGVPGKQHPRWSCTEGREQLTPPHRLPLNTSSFKHIPWCPPHLG